MKKSIVFIVLIQGLFASDYYYKNNQKINLTPLNISSRDMSYIDYYKDDKGITLGITDSLIVKLKNSKDLEHILSSFTLSLEQVLSENLYLLKVTDKSLTIDISNKLCKEEYIEYSHPDFIKKRMAR